MIGKLGYSQRIVWPNARKALFPRRISSEFVRSRANDWLNTDRVEYCQFTQFGSLQWSHIKAARVDTNKSTNQQTNEPKITID